jgi:hypothetical protein
MTEWNLDLICRATTKPSVLNALHACREGHPLGKSTKTPWRDAWFICCQQPSYIIPPEALVWLREQSSIAGERP